jgi:GT2 family glycosyltransferase
MSSSVKKPISESRLAIILVLYNEKLSDSKAYRFLETQDSSFNLLIFDNSTKIDIIRVNQAITKKKNTILIGIGKNLGLSKAYNLALHYIFSNYLDSNWILILDQDTSLNEIYFSEVMNHSQTEEVGVSFPTVMTKHGVLSPTGSNLLCQSSKKTRNLNRSFKFPINSGTLWHKDLFNAMKFDESLFLDMIDYDIFLQLYSNPNLPRIIKMKSSIQQDFSGEKNGTFENDFYRYAGYVNDLRTFSKKWEISSTLTFFTLLKRGFNLGWYHKTFRFIMLLWKSQNI